MFECEKDAAGEQLGRFQDWTTVGADEARQDSTTKFMTRFQCSACMFAISSTRVAASLRIRKCATCDRECCSLL
ncbi:hypothetical protein MPTK1_4g12360 [Marchantia polymorpha subsp. ruderalis]